MAHGTPDWGVTAGAVTTYQLTDLGELAARLGSLDTFDRRGDLIWADGFEFSLNKWETQVSGTGAAAALSTARARNGRYSALLTAGSNGLRSARILHAQPLPALSNLGLEVSFSLGSTIETLTLTYQVFNGVNVAIFSIEWSDITNTLSYNNAAGALVPIATGLDLSTEQSLFHTAKLVADGVSGEYLRLIVDNTSYPLADIATQVNASPVVPSVRTFITVVGRAAQNDTVYADDVILTQNEPA